MGEVIRDFQAGSDEAAVAALWTRAFGAPRGGQTIDWLFRPGPAGVSPRSVAVVGDRIVAHAGGVAVRARVGSEEVLGAYSVGAMTDPAYQGRGLFFKVGLHLYARLEREGFAFVAGFSNAKSHRLMTGPLKRRPVRPFPWAVRVLRPFHLLRSLVVPGTADARAPQAWAAGASHGGVEVASVEPGDPRLDAVWKRAAASVKVGCVRDAAFARWRYGTRPDAGYRVLLAVRAGEPCGYLVYRAMRLRGIEAGFLLDFVLPPDAAPAGAALLGAAAELARTTGAALLSALLPGSGPARDALRSAGFLRIPERLHPQLIRFSVRGLGRHAGTTLLTDPKAWHLSWADTDVV